jgi:hypothetical protein
VSIPDVSLVDGGAERALVFPLRSERAASQSNRFSG